MGDLNALVLKSFGINAKKVIKEKSYYICDTPDGCRMLAKARESAERIVFQHEIKEHLFNAGFPWIDRYLETPDGNPYVIADGERYVLTPFIECREPDLSGTEDILRMIDAAARWHTHARRISFSGAAFAQSVPLTETFKKQAGLINSFRKRVNRQTRLSDFDVLFIKHAGAYADKINEAAESLAQSEYGLRHTQALAENHICHNLLKEETMPIGGGQVYITQYSEASTDIQLNDLCALIRRYAQKAGADALPLAKILESYDRAAPITAEDLAVLRALLLYPHQFVNLSVEFYSKKRSWTPNAMINRMSTVIAGKDFFEGYTGAYFH